MRHSVVVNRAVRRVVMSVVMRIWLLCLRISTRPRQRHNERERDGHRCVHFTPLMCRNLALAGQQFKELTRKGINAIVLNANVG